MSRQAMVFKRGTISTQMMCDCNEMLRWAKIEIKIAYKKRGTFFTFFFLILFSLFVCSICLFIFVSRVSFQLVVSFFVFCSYLFKFLCFQIFFHEFDGPTFLRIFFFIFWDFSHLICIFIIYFNFFCIFIFYFPVI